jgi:hypothetical protein
MNTDKKRNLLSSDEGIERSLNNGACHIFGHFSQKGEKIFKRYLHMQQGLTENMVTLEINTAIVYLGYNLSTHLKVLYRKIHKYPHFTNEAIGHWL